MNERVRSCWSARVSRSTTNARQHVSEHRIADLHGKLELRDSFHIPSWFGRALIEVPGTVRKHPPDQVGFVPSRNVSGVMANVRGKHHKACLVEP